MIEMEFISTRRLNEEGLMTMKNDFNNLSMEMDKKMAGNNSMFSGCKKIIENMVIAMRKGRLRENIIPRKIEKLNDDMANMMIILEEVRQSGEEKTNNLYAKTRARITILGASVDNRVRSAQENKIMIAKIMKKIEELNENMIKMQKTIKEQNIKLDKRQYDEERKKQIKDDNKKGKGKQGKDPSDSEDGDPEEPWPKKKKNDYSDRNIVKIIRDDKGISIIREEKKCRNFNWAEEIEKLMEFMKNCVVENDDTRKDAMIYANELKSRKPIFTCPGNYKKEFGKNARIIDMRTKEPLIKILDSTSHTPHPLIVQCILQNCYEYFEDEDKLKRHVRETHGCSDFVINT
jgi:hypothetical protein